MSYNITHTNGEPLYGNVGLPENTTDTLIYSDGSFGQGIAMIGKLVAEYGTDQSNNFVRIIENFSNINRPDMPLKGMLWFNPEDESLYVCTDEQIKKWVKLLCIKDSTGGDNNNGDIFYDNRTKELKIYDSELSDWVVIGPVNYEHRKVNPFLLTTYSGNVLNSAILNLPNENASFLTTIKIVAREKFSEEYEINLPNDNIPETAAWICNLLIERHKKTEVVDDDIITLYDTKIIGNPNYQIIAKTDGMATTWEVLTEIDTNENLIVSVKGVGSNDLNVSEQDNHIEWEIEIETLKV